MATRNGRTPRKPKDAGDYTAIGKFGRLVTYHRRRCASLSEADSVVYRKTGAILEDTGVRDEHGMEPIPSFSSPQRLPIDTNGVNHGNNDETYTGDQTMEISNGEHRLFVHAASARL